MARPGVEDFRSVLAQKGIEDRCAARLVRGDPKFLGYYLRYSQFEEQVPVFYVSDEFEAYVAGELRTAFGAGCQSLRSSLPAPGLPLAHEYGHVIAELSFVANRMTASGSAVTSRPLARRLWDVIRKWHGGPRGKEERLPRRSRYLRPGDPAFLRDGTALLDGETAARVAIVLRLPASCWQPW